MPIFAYKARNNRGDSISGEIEAGNADMVASQLLNSDITPITISEVERGEDIFVNIRKRMAEKPPTLDDLILFCRQMYTLNKAGVPIIRGITGLSENTRNPVLADILRKVVLELESGRELSQAMSYHSDIFPQLVINMVKVGENTGRLDEAFLQLSEYLERDRETRDQVKAALRYPAFVIFAIGVAIGIINYWVIPTFARVFKNMGAELPWQTKILIALSDFTVAYWPLIIGTLLVAIFAGRAYMRTAEGRYRWDKYKLRLPIIGDIIYRATLSRFTRAFAMATHAGVPIIQTLTVVSRAVDNAYIGDRILSMRNGVERGDNLTRTAAATGMFTPLVIQMINVGEETGAVDEMMTEVADFYDREIAYDIKNLSAAIEPILLIFVGIMVLVLALGVFLPMWDLGSAALKK